MKRISILHAGHIEEPIEQFLVAFHHDGLPVGGGGMPVFMDSTGTPVRYPWNEPEDRVVRVLAETREGALKIAAYHHSQRGSRFRLLSQEPLPSDTRGAYLLGDGGVQVLRGPQWEAVMLALPASA